MGREGDRQGCRLSNNSNNNNSNNNNSNNNNSNNNNSSNNNSSSSSSSSNNNNSQCRHRKTCHHKLVDHLRRLVSRMNMAMCLRIRTIDLRRNKCTHRLKETL